MPAHTIRDVHEHYVAAYARYIALILRTRDRLRRQDEAALSRRLGRLTLLARVDPSLLAVRAHGARRRSF